MVPTKATWITIPLVLGLVAMTLQTGPFGDARLTEQARGSPSGDATGADLEGADIDDEEGSVLVKLEGEILPFAVRFTPTADNTTFKWQRGRCWPTGSQNVFATNFIVTRNMIETGLDMYPPSPPEGNEGHAEGVYYFRPLSVKSHFLLSVSTPASSAFVENPLFGKFATVTWGRASFSFVQGEEYWWVIACSGSWDLAVEVTGASLGDPVPLGPFGRAVWSENDFEEIGHVSNAFWGQPNVAVGTEAVHRFEVRGPQYLVAYMTESTSLSEKSLKAPDGTEIPFYRHTMGGWGVGIGGTFLYLELDNTQADRLITQQGTWTFTVDPKASPDFEASLYRLDLSALVST